MVNVWLYSPVRHVGTVASVNKNDENLCTHTVLVGSRSKNIFLTSKSSSFLEVSSLESQGEIHRNVNEGENFNCISHE